MRGRGLGLLFPRPECILIDKLCSSLKRMQNKEEDVSGGRTEAGRSVSSSRKAGEHRWLLRAWLCICSVRFPYPPGCTVSTRAGSRCLQQFNGKKKKKRPLQLWSNIKSLPVPCEVGIIVRILQRQQLRLRAVQSPSHPAMRWQS